MDELNAVVDILHKEGIGNTRIDETLKRGQAYYTGIVFEFFDTNPENNRSILGGGRYDNLTALFGDSELPAAGFGMGDVTTRDFLETHGLLPAYKPATQIAVLLPDMKLVEAAVEFVIKLRMSGVNAAIDFSDHKLGDQIKNADKNKIANILVFGEEEMKSGRYKLKELSTGNETVGGLDEIVKIFKK
jgi:histidyl-tRNA synthetase